MRTVFLCGIPESEARLIGSVLSSPQFRALDYRLASGIDAAQSASVMIVNGDDPAALRRWVAARQDFPHPLGVVLTSHAPGGNYFAEQILRRPVSMASVVSALDQLETLLASGTVACASG
jgi:hypothetical protein